MTSTDPAADPSDAALEFQPREILRTGHMTTCPWPVDVFLQGGSTGLVITDDGTYRTAFVEAFPDKSFIRGEGSTVAEAEAAAWGKYCTYAACPGHQWKARGYVNGAGFCSLCGMFASKVFTAEELGQYCEICGIATMWQQEQGKFRCEEHTIPIQERLRPAGFIAGFVHEMELANYEQAQQQSAIESESATEPDET